MNSSEIPLEELLQFANVDVHSDLTARQVSGSDHTALTATNKLSDANGADFTGTRCYKAATMALFRFCCQTMKPIFGTETTIAEIGCGIGILSMALKLGLDPKYIMATDGCARTVDLARSNLEQLQTNHANCFAQQLLWGDRGQESLILDQLKDFTGHDGFDVIVGSELFYYGCDLDSLVDSCVRFMDDKLRSVIIFAQIYRDVDLPVKLSMAASRHGLTAFEVPSATVASEALLNADPSGFLANVRLALVCSQARADELCLNYPTVEEMEQSLAMEEEREDAFLFAELNPEAPS